MFKKLITATPIYRVFPLSIFFRNFCLAIMGLQRNHRDADLIMSKVLKLRFLFPPEKIPKT